MDASIHVLPSPAPPQQYGAEPDLNFIVTTPPSAPSASSRTTSRSSARPRVTRKSKRKAETTSSSSPRNRGSRETSAMTAEDPETEVYDTSTTTSSPGLQDSSYVFQSQNTFRGQSFQQNTAYLPSMGGAQYPTMQNEYLQYQSMQSYGPPPGMQYSYAPPPPPQQQQYQTSPNYSRIEDVRRASGSKQGGEGKGDGTEVSSQYIVATQDTVWRARP
ncbi:hypothetical protein EG329_010429 [Mollisiaceae sp. DMI_Dod_QoI]|nr:hypothetical protein EG329_010429 [Helotiales sp. DMI_Dod_QoI]